VLVRALSPGRTWERLLFCAVSCPIRALRNRRHVGRGGHQGARTTAFAAPCARP
jgi:hypothetical protein